MIRLALCSLALSACAAVYGLEDVTEPPPPCGPYGDPTQVQFSAELTSPVNFSLGSADGSGTDGSGSDGSGSGVLPLRGSVEVPTGIVIVKNEAGDGLAWETSLDPGDNMTTGDPTAGLNAKVGRLVLGGGAFASDVNEQTISFFLASPGGWLVQSDLVDTDQDSLTIVGNAVDEHNADGTEFHTVMLSHIPATADTTPRLELFQRSSPMKPWVSNLPRTNQINADHTLVAIDRAVLTHDKQRLIYSAKYSDDNFFQLYVSSFDKQLDTFLRGSRIDSVDDPTIALTAPSIDDGCKTLYFARGDETVVVHSQD